MIKMYSVTDENFYNTLKDEQKEYFKGYKEDIDMGFIPMVQIKREGHPSGWYNKHIGKIYQIYKYIIETDNGYINYIVYSKEDGTQKGFKPQFSSNYMGKGLDIVHSVACELTMGLKIKRDEP